MVPLYFTVLNRLFESAHDVANSSLLTGTAVPVYC